MAQGPGSAGAAVTGRLAWRPINSHNQRLLIHGVRRGRRTLNDLTWQEFERVDLRVGTVTKAEPFPEARKPAFKLTVDFGGDVGMRKCSAQITDHYTPEALVGKQVVGVVNFPRKQIGPFMSECLITGFVQADGSVILAVPDLPASNGTRLA